MKLDIHQFDFTAPHLELNFAYSVLDIAEQQKAERFVTSDLRDKFIYAHALLRQVLAEKLSVTPESLHYQYNSSGKPELKNHPLHFNLSHSKDLVLIGICEEAPIGVDIEFAREHENYRQIAQRFFSELEIAAIKNLSDFYRIWTRKEAYLKMLGHGVSFGLNKFSVSAKAEGLDCLILAEKELIQNCYLGSLETAENYVAAVCAPNISKLSLNYYSH